jgi:hypothetical protein
MNTTRWPVGTYVILNSQGYSELEPTCSEYLLYLQEINEVVEVHGHCAIMVPDLNKPGHPKTAFFYADKSRFDQAVEFECEYV